MRAADGSTTYASVSPGRWRPKRDNILFTRPYEFRCSLNVERVSYTRFAQACLSTHLDTVSISEYHRGTAGRRVSGPVWRTLRGEEGMVVVGG